MDEAHFDQILDHCIDRIAKGEDVERCLQDYPRQAAELEPLLRVAFTTCEASAVEPRPEFKVQARQQLSSALYRQKPKAQPGRILLLDRAKSRVGSGIQGLRTRPVFQKALAGVVAVALIVGLSLTVPPLLGESPVALAEELAMEDPGIQVLLAEKGFDPSNVHRVGVKANGGNIYLVHLTNPTDDAPIGTVTVDMEERRVTKIGLIMSREEYVQPLRPIGLAIMEDIMEGIREDARVQELLAAGAKVGGASYFSSLSSPQRQVVGLELRLGGRSWLLKMDPQEGEVISMFERQPWP
ncbi:MAG: hypothetical protein ISS53_00480 [Dehalococcoidia bacterium]|nr:hypothetical protein [Dehalococcoidia bacterium]